MFEFAMLMVACCALIVVGLIAKSLDNKK